jgi:hypothetical protein
MPLRPFRRNALSQGLSPPVLRPPSPGQGDPPGQSLLCKSVRPPANLPETTQEKNVRAVWSPASSQSESPVFRSMRSACVGGVASQVLKRLTP